MLTNAAMANIWTEIDGLFIQFDGCQLTIQDTDGNELYVQSKVFGYMLSKADLARISGE